MSKRMKLDGVTALILLFSASATPGLSQGHSSTTEPSTSTHSTAAKSANTSQASVRSKVLSRSAASKGTQSTSVAPSPTVPTASSKNAEHFRPITARPGDAKYVQYMAAGDAAHAKRNDTKAKEYYLAALSSFEQSHGGQPGHFPRLEHRLISMYPDDWSKSKLDEKDKLKAQEEQVSVLERVVHITRQAQLGAGPGRMVASIAESSLKKAQDDLERTKAGLSTKEGSEK